MPDSNDMVVEEAPRSTPKSFILFFFYKNNLKILFLKRLVGIYFLNLINLGEYFGYY